MYVSKPQIKALQYILDNSNGKISKQTIEALRRKGHIQETTMELTEMGFNMAVASTSLRKQCESLDIELRVEELKRNHKNPELDLMDYYKAKGYKVTWDETGSAVLGNIVTAMLLEPLQSFFQQEYPHDDSDYINTHLITLSPWTHVKRFCKDKIKEAILNADREQLKRICRRSIPIRSNMIWKQ